MQGFHGGDYFSAKTVPQGVASRVLMNITEQELAEAVGSPRETGGMYVGREGGWRDWEEGRG